MFDVNPDSHLIEKKTLYGGSKAVDFRDGTKVHLHFQTRLCNSDKTLIDDSRKIGQGEPLALVLGKKFKLEVWEVLVQKMSLHEVASFTVDQRLVREYPFISKTIRDAHNKKGAQRVHQCAMTLQTEGLGYNDLNTLLKDPQDLEFIFELVNVEQPDSYEREIWQMTADEKLGSVPTLKEQGNRKFKEGDWQGASDLYAKAIGILEELLIKEKPREEEWNDLNKMKLPLLLNYSQCKLSQGEYYPVIEHCTTAIGIDPENVKAYYRRAKAYVAVWSPREALQDYAKVMELDKTLTAAVKKEISALEELQKEKDAKDMAKLKNLFI